MGVVGSAVAFVKTVWRALVWLVLLPVRVPKRLYRGATNIRGTSAATKALTLVAMGLGALAGAGMLFATQANVDMSASSAPLITALLEWMTNGWGYVLAAIVFGRGTVWGIRRARIGKAAEYSGYKPQVIERLADEIRTTNGTNRAIIFGDDDHAEARDRILETFQGDDDFLFLDEGALEEASSQDVGESAITIPGPADDAGDDGEADGEPSRAERFKLWRMDLATGLRTDAIIWQFLVPTAVVFILELVLVQFWVRWWLYPSLLAGAALVGLLIYKGTQWRRNRRLARLRQNRGGDTWEEIVVLVKTVETDELTVHMGYLAGRRYASTDRFELADTLASRALERSHGYHPSPAIEERYAWCLDRYIVNFDGWRENMEKPDIMDQLVDEVLDAEEGMLPKGTLAHRVVEHDRKYIWQGLRFVGMGYDPDLVAECYEELVPNTLVEHDIVIESPEGKRYVTAVRARTEALPPDVSRLRANFSERFPLRKLPDRYSLPGVDPDEATHGFAVPGSD